MPRFPATLRALRGTPLEAPLRAAQRGSSAFAIAFPRTEPLRHGDMHANAIPGYRHAFAQGAHVLVVVKRLLDAGAAVDAAHVCLVMQFAREASLRSSRAVAAEVPAAALSVLELTYRGTNAAPSASSRQYVAWLAKSLGVCGLPHAPAADILGLLSDALRTVGTPVEPTVAANLIDVCIEVFAQRSCGDSARQMGPALGPPLRILLAATTTLFHPG